MATATLVLGEPQLVTLEVTSTNLREVVIPRGTRTLKCSSREEWFLELGDAETADGDAGTAAEQFRYDAGTFSDKMPGFGLSAAQCLNAATSVFLAGSVASQEIWLWAISETG